MSPIRLATASLLCFLILAAEATLHQPIMGLSRRYGGHGGWYGNGGGYGYGGSSGGDSSSSSSNDGFGGLSGESLENAVHYRRVHGIVASVAMVVLFPLGSIVMRLIPWRFTIWIHAATQVLAYCLFIAGAALGIYLVRTVDIPYLGNMLTNSRTNYHPIIGLVCLTTLFFQPILGYVHHARFKQLGRRTVWSHIHLWNGRLSISLGIINGGLGLYLSRAARSTKVAYAVVAALLWFLWLIVAVWGEFRRTRDAKYEGFHNAQENGKFGTEHPPMTAAAAAAPASHHSRRLSRHVSIATRDAVSTPARASPVSTVSSVSASASPISAVSPGGASGNNRQR